MIFFRPIFTYLFYYVAETVAFTDPYPSEISIESEGASFGLFDLSLFR